MEQYDKLIFLGDFVGYYYNPNEIIEMCRGLDVTCLLGNHDSYFLRVLKRELNESDLVRKYGHSYIIAKETITNESINFLKNLSSSVVLEIEGKRLFLCHGSPVDSLEGRIYPDTDLDVFNDSIGNKFDYVICGHTHHKISRQLNRTIFLNPGSLGQQRDGLGCSYLLIDFKTDEWEIKIVDYPIHELEKQIDLYDHGNIRLKEVLRRQPK